MNPCELTTGVTALANVLASGLSDDELGMTAALFTQLGDTLATIAVQRSICGPSKTIGRSCVVKELFAGNDTLKVRGEEDG